MKRTGYIYDRMADWDTIVEAERIATKNKTSKRHIQNHIRNRIANLTEIQQSVISHSLETDTYRHMRRVSGQGKMRDIAKLNFHPSHIQHQLLVLVGDGKIDRSLIRHTYASRKGYGQHKGALQLNRWVQCNRDYKWYVQFDIRKYYDSIPHILIRNELERIFKDKDYVDAFIEPFCKFSESGKGIPLGIRPSQTAGNLALSSFDRFVKEELKVRFYIRYLDDSVALCRTKGEARIIAKRVEKFLNELGFEIHVPRIDKVENGIDFLGYVCYPDRGMFWRSSTKKAWLKRRSHITNRKRLREIDAAAWGYLSHGNKHCKRLYKKMNGVDFSSIGIEMPANTDKDGNRIIEAQKVAMDMVLGNEIIVTDIVPNVKTKMGDGRMVVEIEMLGKKYKLIVNATPIKQKLSLLWGKGITSISTVFIDTGGKHYDIDFTRTKILTIYDREVAMANGTLIYKDNNEPINIK